MKYSLKVLTPLFLLLLLSLMGCSSKKDVVSCPFTEITWERLPEIAKNAIADACTGSNPRQPSQEEMEKLLKCCYYDTEVDF